MSRFEKTHYVPILRWKEAERNALAQLSRDVSTRVTPLIELIGDDFGKSGSGTSVQEKAAAISGHLFRCWGEPLFIDLRYVPEGPSPEVLDNLIGLLGSCSKAMGVSLIPVTGM